MSACDTRPCNEKDQAFEAARLLVNKTRKSLGGKWPALPS